MNRKDTLDHAKKKRRNWFIHLIIFMMGQFAFFILDDYAHWTIFNLNPLGEWIEANLSHLWSWIQLYEFHLFNLVTMIWGLLVIIDGIMLLFYASFQRKRNHLSR